MEHHASKEMALKVMELLEKHLHMEEARHHGMLTILPLIGNPSGGPDFCSLRQGLEAGLLITEVGMEGAVPTLKAVNRSGRNVLILDGEELAGAKQNRVLNTTILIAAGAEIELPVSCTEQGRWHWKSESFMDSDVVMTPGMRSRKNMAVERNLKHRARYESNQSELWMDIQRFSTVHRASSETMAMRDAFEAKRNQQVEYQKHLPCLPNQCGMLAIIKGNVVSLEVIARAEVYADLHEKLLRSLVMDIPLWEPAYDSESMAGVPIFLKHLRHCTHSVYPSIGMGQDVRFQGHHLIGSALVVEEEIVHMAFFHQSRKYLAGSGKESFKHRKL